MPRSQNCMFLWCEITVRQQLFAYCLCFILSLADIWMDMSRNDETVTILNFGEALDRNLKALRKACNDAYTFEELKDFASIMEVDPSRMSETISNAWSDMYAYCSESVAGALLYCVNATSNVKYPARRL